MKAIIESYRHINMSHTAIETCDIRGNNQREKARINKLAQKKVLYHAKNPKLLSCQPDK